MKFKEGKVDIRFLVLGICLIFLLVIVSADIVSINSGGDNQLIINPESAIEGFFFNFNLRPLMSNVILSSTFGTNFTTENLSVTYTSSDPDNDVITNISDWRLGGNSIAVLNMPFDSYKFQGTTRDYSSYENNGTLGSVGNVPIWNSSCIVGGCYGFDGETDSIYGSQSISNDGANGITMGGWVYLLNSDVNTYASMIILGSQSATVGYHWLYFNDATGYAYWQYSNGSSVKVSSKNLAVSQNQWTHIVISHNYISGDVKFYKNGDLMGTNNFGDFPISIVNKVFRLGTYSSSTMHELNGSLDEIFIFNRTLSDEQIQHIFDENSQGKSMETLVSQETDKGDVWSVAMTSNDGFYDSVTVLSNELTIVNDAPIDPEPILVSLDGSNESDVDLNCSSFVYDPDSNSLDVSVRWYKDDILNLTLNYGPYSNASLFYSILDSGNLTLGDVWKCEVRLDDGEDYSNWVESNNLTIIDVTDPIVYIISPEPINYSYLNISFNVSIVENENVSMCFYNLDDEGNVTMNELNDSYFWYEPTLGPGYHEVWFYCNDTSGNWGSNYTNFTIDNEAAIAILLSPLLLQQVRWDVLSLPIDDLDAVGNNENNVTDYFVNISATNTLVDLYVRADDDLFNAGLDVIGLGNETFAVSNNNSYVNDTAKVAMNTTYVLIGNALGDNSTVFLKFYLDAPASQAAGEYLNQLDFKAVREGQSP